MMYTGKFFQFNLCLEVRQSFSLEGILIHSSMGVYYYQLALELEIPHLPCFQFLTACSTTW